MRNSLIASLLATAAGLLTTPHTLAIRPNPRPVTAVMAEPVESVEDCIASSESGAEAEECLVPFAESATKPAPASAEMKSEEETRSMLMGADDSLEACLSSAEGKAEIDECELDYDKLVEGPTTPSVYDELGDSEGLGVGPVALAGAAVVVAALVFFN
eukprot:5933014-Prymnesium_polylepis.2